MNAKWIASASLGILLLLPAEAVLATGSQDLRDVSVLGHHFSTRISSGTRRVEAKGTSTSRFAILKLSVVAPSDGDRLFSSDFVLAYRRDGKEDRANGTAICRAKTADVGEESSCAVGQGGTWIGLVKGQQYIAVAFFVESDVDAVDIYRLGVRDPVAYRLGSERPVSVYLTTNDDVGRLKRVEEALDAGGYQVVRVSEKLTEKTKGVVIHYAPGAETQAREMSQRIMQVTDDVPTLKKTSLVTTKDVVIWLGH